MLFKKTVEYYKDQRRILAMNKERNKKDYIDICLSLGHLSIKLDLIEDAKEYYAEAKALFDTL